MTHFNISVALNASEKISHNLSQNILRPVDEIKKSRIFTKTLMAYFVHFLRAFMKFLVSEERLCPRLYLY